MNQRVFGVLPLNMVGNYFYLSEIFLFAPFWNFAIIEHHQLYPIISTKTFISIIYPCYKITAKGSDDSLHVMCVCLRGVRAASSFATSSKGATEVVAAAGIPGRSDPSLLLNVHIRICIDDIKIQYLTQQGMASKPKEICNMNMLHQDVQYSLIHPNRLLCISGSIAII